MDESPVAAAAAGRPPPDRHGADRHGADRYGAVPAHPLAHRIAGIVLVLGVAAALAWWLWLAAVRSNPPVRWQVTGYDATSGTAVDIRWQVERDPGVAVECVLRARDARGEEVGRVRVVVPVDDAEGIDMSHTLKTSGQAVTGEVLTCVELTR